VIGKAMRTMLIRKANIYIYFVKSMLICKAMRTMPLRKANGYIS
jgi:hypothetical protein